MTILQVLNSGNCFFKGTVKQRTAMPGPCLLHGFTGKVTIKIEDLHIQTSFKV